MKKIHTAAQAAGRRSGASDMALATTLAWATLVAPSSAHGAAAGADATDTATTDTSAAVSSVENGDAAPEIVVTGQHDRQAVPTGALGTRSVLDTPLSIGQVDAYQIARMAATTIDQAFAYDAGIRSNNSGVASGNTFSVRGLPIDRTNGYKVDGLPFPYWFQDTPIESLQAIEVLKGAGGFVYGFAPPGGVVNLISKRPTADFEATVSLQYRSANILRELIDIGGPLDKSGSVKFRFNAVNEQGTLYNGAYNKDQMASLALTGDVTDRLSWNLDGFYQRTRQDNQVNSITINTGTVKVNGVTYGPVTSLKAVDGNFQPGATGTTKSNDIVSITGRLNYQIATNWKASVAARFATLDERFPGSLATIYDNQGDYYSTVYNMNRLFKYYVIDATTTGKFSTGPIDHEIVAGLSSLTDQFLYDNPTRNFVLGPANNSAPAVQNVSNAYVFNIYNQNNQPTIIGNAAAQYNNRPPVYTLYQEVHQRAAYISDTASYGPLSVLVGMRYTHYDEFNINPGSSAISTFKYRPFTPIYAVTLKLPKTIRAYFSYVEALQDGAIAPVTATNSGASFKRYGIGAISYNNATVPIEVTGEQHGAGAYDGGGRTGVLSVLFNGIVNLGQRGAAWRGFVGGGVGLARISSGEWTLAGRSAATVIGATAAAGTNTDKSVAIPTYFSDDNASAFAWQAIAGVRHPITDKIDLSLKYRFFDVPGLRLRTESGNPINGNLRSHSLLIGATFHL